MIITKEEGTPYYVATHKGKQYLGYSAYEAMMRCVENIWKYSKLRSGLQSLSSRLTP
jgi:hypothetical protein